MKKRTAKHKRAGKSAILDSVTALPLTPAEWVKEIANAYMDAAEALPFIALAGAEPDETQLFQLAPHVAIKFRGLPRTRSDKAVEGALSSYVATKDQNEAIVNDPPMAFAFCYLASHFALGLIEEVTVAQIMDFIERNRERLSTAILSL